MAIVVGFAEGACIGVGDVDDAKAKIEPGMSKGEVRSVLGRPQVSQYEDEWDYWGS